MSASQNTFQQSGDGDNLEQFRGISRIYAPFLAHSDISDDVKSEITSQKDTILSILSQSDPESTSLYSDIKHEHKKALGPLESQLSGYHSYLQISSILSSPAHVMEYLNRFIRSIDTVLENYEDENTGEKENIFEAYENLDDRFIFTKEFVEEKIEGNGFLWFYIFVQHCISQGRYLESIITSLEDIENDSESITYWRCRNLVQLAEVRKKMTEKEKSEDIGNGLYYDPEGYSLTLSGGVANCINQLGVLEKRIQENPDGFGVRLIVGTSMGAIFGGLIALGVSPGQIKLSLEELGRGNLGRKEFRVNFERAMFQLAESAGINENSSMGETKIPFVVNAGLKNGENDEEIFLSQHDSFLKSIRASAKMDFFKDDDIFDDTHFEGQELYDYAQRVATIAPEIATNLGVPLGKQIVISSGYSSQNNKTPSARAMRLWFGDSIIKDCYTTLGIILSGGKVYETNPRDIGGTGMKVSPDIVNTRYESGKNREATSL